MVERIWIDHSPISGDMPKCSCGWGGSLHGCRQAAIVDGRTHVHNVHPGDYNRAIDRAYDRGK